LNVQVSSDNKIDTKYNKYDLFIFPKIDSNFVSKEDQQVITYFSKKNHRVFYFKIDIKSTKGTEEDLYNMKQYLDKVIRENVIKDCVLVVEDPNWQQVIIYLKDQYGFKIVLNYSQKMFLQPTDQDHLFSYDDKILEFSDEIIIFTPNPDASTKIKNHKVSILKNSCSPEYIEGIINRVYKFVSIVIVTFNNLNYTQQCINSIFEKTAYPNYEIIIVDNNSQDETADYLVNLEKKFQNITVILNKENLGFAKANNIGIRQAKGDYIILLNNDTVVTKGWITGFIKHLDRYKELGLIGPVTNGACTESRIEINYNSIEEMDAFADEYTFNNLNLLYGDMDMLEMFCVAMKRKIIDEIGYLDESFGKGTFEDDDYCYRIKLHGYMITCAEDVFIHHFGSASFNKLQHEERWNIFYKNKEIFEKKWGTTWKQHYLRNSRF
jgi:GT2 family glycosyltransferase